MNEKLVSGVVAITAGIIAVAIIAVIVSPRSETTNVLKSGGDVFSTIVRRAVSPTIQ